MGPFPSKTNIWKWIFLAPYQSWNQNHVMTHDMPKNKAWYCIEMLICSWTSVWNCVLRCVKKNECLFFGCGRHSIIFFQIRDLLFGPQISPKCSDDVALKNRPGGYITLHAYLYVPGHNEWTAEKISNPIYHYCISSALVSFPSLGVVSFIPPFSLFLCSLNSLRFTSPSLIVIFIGHFPSPYFLNEPNNFSVMCHRKQSKNSRSRAVAFIQLYTQFETFPPCVSSAKKCYELLSDLIFCVKRI